MTDKRDILNLHGFGEYSRLERNIKRVTDEIGLVKQNNNVTVWYVSRGAYCELKGILFEYGGSTVYHQEPQNEQGLKDATLSQIIEVGQGLFNESVKVNLTKHPHQTIV